MLPKLQSSASYSLFLLVVFEVGCSPPTKPSQPETSDVVVSQSEPKKVVEEPKPVELEPLPSFEGAVEGTFSISQVMQLAHKNKLYRELFNEGFDPSVGERLAMLYASLPKQSSPKGDAEDWTKRSNALADAAAKVVAGEDGAAAAFKRAVNCNSCHSRHKP